MALEFILLDEFFATARERYQIKLRRELGGRPPWTNDPQFREWRFCQVHREDDRTTLWFRNNIRKPLSDLCAPGDSPIAHKDMLQILRSTLIFRWFNRIETGQIILDLLVDEWDTKEARERLKDIHPVVTGAYIIKAGDGVSKLDGILACIDEAIPQLPIIIEKSREKPPSLERAWSWVKELHFMGGFMSYEVVSDLRWTPLLEDAIDINTWANAGPGCARGLGWVVAGNSDTFNCGPKNQRVMLSIMRELLEYSKSPLFWPQDWQHWEMREVEHWNCEFDKYMRAKNGDRLKRRYTYGG